MQYVLIIHEVENYYLWKDIFDEAAMMRKKAGEIHYQLLRYENDENSIVHLSLWESLAKAKLFFESPDLVSLRKEAGVKEPNFIYLKEIERGLL